MTPSSSPVTVVPRPIPSWSSHRRHPSWSSHRGQRVGQRCRTSLFGASRSPGEPDTSRRGRGERRSRERSSLDHHVTLARLIVPVNPILPGFPYEGQRGDQRRPTGVANTRIRIARQGRNLGHVAPCRRNVADLNRRQARSNAFSPLPGPDRGWGNSSRQASDQGDFLAPKLGETFWTGTFRAPGGTRAPTGSQGCRTDEVDLLRRGRGSPSGISRIDTSAGSAGLLLP